MAYRRETKKARKDRLEAAGKWTDFKNTRDELVQRYLDQGMDEKEATKQGGKEADSLFDNYGTKAEIEEVQQEQVRRRNSAPQPKAIDMLVKAGIAKQSEGPGIISPEVEIRWVHQNLMVSWDEIDPQSVPTGGAVALLEQAKGDFRWFFEKFYSKLMVSRTVDETNGEGDGEDPAEVESMIGDLLTPAQMQAVQ